jgi:hypothetical protein
VHCWRPLLSNLWMQLVPVVLTPDKRLVNVLLGTLGLVVFGLEAGSGGTTTL